MKVIKHSGRIVPFDIEKLKNSLQKSGASPNLIEKCLNQIQDQIYDGITTKQIYKLAFAILKKAASGDAARYNLRSALQMLGPDGFFFEKFISLLYAEEGYKTKTNLILQGKCVSHEVDIVLKKENRISMIECKFHNSREKSSDVKVPMYILSRFNDLQTKQHTLFSNNETINSCIIVTNNRFTKDAETFANCSKIELLSWDYPKNNNIKNKIDEAALYPITCLTTLSMFEKEQLLILNIILTKDLITNSESLYKIGLKEKRIKNVLKEASQICKLI
ncbi:ATP cone domain-containing protein [Flavobacterium sp. KACC 22761]|uniref:ATP cone domain-containing protein n=1 Tax=Flavobacterium sp. KACC 22761 TaxID=3092665 RepID=UPI002A755A43|nr:ATP cone domain-containing protein [Flavobacterium sp. KACC 22761]WPO78539.1 ATP cone domain-containing protein [Flavobacterium sp. KACC 22761]